MRSNRRDFLASAAALGAAGFVSGLATAAPDHPKPAHATAGAALAALVAGNKRFMAGTPMHTEHTARLEALTGGQAPFAMILSCSDSRVPPEIIFDLSLGDVFSVRLAGNFAENDGIGSIQYAVAHFGSPLLLVLGHTGCGAIHATVGNVEAGSPPVAGNIADVVKAISPAVKAVLGKPGDIYANATQENVRENVARLKNVSVIIGEALKAGHLEIVGGIYDLKTGRVNLL